MDESECIKIKLSSKLGKRAPVFLTEFSCGELKENSKIKFECFKSDNDSGICDSKATRKLVAHTGHLSYEGSSNDMRQNQRYYVGVRDKKSGKMKLYDSSYFYLKPKLKYSAPNVTPNIPSVSNYWEEKKKLTTAFGSKVQKRILNSQMKLAANEETLENTLQDDSVDSSSLPSASLTESPLSIPYLPLINRQAQSLDEVFNVTDVIKPEEDLLLQDEVNNWLLNYASDGENAFLNFCSFTKQNMEKYLEDPMKIKYLLYYNYLVIFQNLTYADIRRKDPTPLIPESFKGNLINKFTCITKSESGRSSRNFPTQQKDNIVANILILALYVNDYCVNINEILPDLKRVTPKQFILIAQNMGCYITSRSIDGQSVKFAELKLPLNSVAAKYSKKQF